jgi:hypothetical protein
VFVFSPQARGKKEEEPEQTKSDLLEKLQEEIAEHSHRANVRGDDLLTEVAAMMTRRLQEGERDHKICRHYLTGLNREDLVKFAESVDSKNSELKIATFKNALFRDNVRQLNVKEKTLDAVKKGLLAVSKSLLVMTYGSESGSIAWAIVKDEIAEAIKRIDKTAGAAELLHQQRAVAEAAHAAGLVLGGVAVAAAAAAEAMNVG